MECSQNFTSKGIMMQAFLIWPILISFLIHRRIEDRLRLELHRKNRIFLNKMKMPNQLTPIVLILQKRRANNHRMGNPKTKTTNRRMKNSIRRTSYSILYMKKKKTKTEEPRKVKTIRRTKKTRILQ
jgi:hypothetical protein